MQTVSQKMKYTWDNYFKDRHYEFEFELEDEDREKLWKAEWVELYKLVEWLVEWVDWDIEAAKYECWVVDWYRTAIEDLVNHFRNIEISEDALCLWKELKKTFTAEKIADMFERLLK